MSDIGENFEAEIPRGLRDWFPGFHPRRKKELSSFVRSGLIVLDANVLLDLYRYVPQARADLMSSLAAVGNRLWIPHQAAKEFHDRRFTAIDNQARSFAEAKKSIETCRDSAIKSIKNLRNSCSIPEGDLASSVRELTSAFNHALAQIAQLENALDMDANRAIAEDHILDSIESLLAGKVGPPLEAEQLNQLSEEAKERYARQIPPGYEDADKNGNRPLGDLILWRQIIREASRRNLPVMLVSREQKKDWVRRRDDAILGPRPELVDEMREVAGVDFHLVSPATFLGLANSELGIEIDASTVESVSRSVTMEAGPSGARATAGNIDYLMAEYEAAIIAVNTQRARFEEVRRSGMAAQAMEADLRQSLDRAQGKVEPFKNDPERARILAEASAAARQHELVMQHQMVEAEEGLRMAKRRLAALKAALKG